MLVVHGVGNVTIGGGRAQGFALTECLYVCDNVYVTPHRPQEAHRAQGPPWAPPGSPWDPQVSLGPPPPGTRFGPGPGQLDCETYHFQTPWAADYIPQCKKLAPPVPWPLMPRRSFVARKIGKTLGYEEGLALMDLLAKTSKGKGLPKILPACGQAQLPHPPMPLHRPTGAITTWGGVAGVAGI